MSRVGKKPIILPPGVKVTIEAGQIIVEGPLGTISQKLNSLIKLINQDGALTFEPTDSSLKAKKMWGTMRALVANMVKGVTQGFEKKLMVVGVGFRAQAQDRKLNLSLGFSHQISDLIPDGIEVKTPAPTEIVLKGKDKQAVGECAAKVRRYRQPERYKGKGLRYADEIVILKETKKK